MIGNVAKKRTLVSLVVALLALGLPSTIVAGSPKAPSGSDVAPSALKLPNSAFPSGSAALSYPMPPEEADASASTGEGPNPFQPGSVFHSTPYTASGMLGGWTQTDVYTNPAGYKEATIWLASIYGTDAEAAARVQEAKTSLRSGHVVEGTPCPRVSAQNCSVFSFEGVPDQAHWWLLVATTTTPGNDLVLYAVWSVGNVVAELALYGIPGATVEPDPTVDAGHFATALTAADATVNAAVAPAPGPAVAPTAPPTATSVPILTSMATPTVAPTLAPTATVIPTAAASELGLRVAVKGSLRVGQAGSIQVTVTSAPAAFYADRHGANASGRVSGATVTVDARRVGMAQVLRGKTNSRGAVAFKNLRPVKSGRIKVKATKAGFASATITIRVRP